MLRYDPGANGGLDPDHPWTDDGILNDTARVVVTGTGTYLEVQVTRFSIFGALGSILGGGGGGGGGWCALVPFGGSKPMEFFLPIGVCIVIGLALRARDMRRRRKKSN